MTAETKASALSPKIRNRLISLLCWFNAIVITFALSAATAYCGWFHLFALVSILWVALDSKRVRLWRYHTGISGGPTTIFILLLILGWPIVFPWYLGMRLKIMTGVARLREEYEPWRMTDSTVSPNGLLQPWSGRKV